MTPLDALNFLNQLKRKIKSGEEEDKSRKK